MRAPRVRVGVLTRGNSPAHLQASHNSSHCADLTEVPHLPGLVNLSELLSSHGHQVTQLTDLQEIPHLEVIFLQAEGQALSKAVEDISPYLHSGQIVIHTSLRDGITVLDTAEIRGAVVICAYPVAPDVWVTTTLDDLGATVAELFFGGLSARVVPVADTDRPDFLAALQHARKVQREHAEVAEWLHRYLPDPQDVASLLMPTSLLAGDSTPSHATPHHVNSWED